MAAVEWLYDQLPDDLRMSEMGINMLTTALAMEKQNLLDMSLKSALHERKWLYEEMSGKKYKPSQIEIRDLKKTALEHYDETFKSE